MLIWLVRFYVIVKYKLASMLLMSYHMHNLPFVPNMRDIDGTMHSLLFELPNAKVVSTTFAGKLHYVLSSLSLYCSCSTNFHNGW